MRDTSSISRAVVGCWLNQASKAVGGRSVLALSCGSLALFAAVFGYFATKELIYPAFSSFSRDTAAVTAVVMLALMNVSVMVSMLLSVFLVLSPSQTALDNLLATMPVRQSARVMGYFLPLIIVTMLATAVMFSPVLISLLYDAGLSTFGVAWVTFAFASHLAYVVLLNLGVYLVTLTLLVRTLAAEQSLSRLASALAMSSMSLATLAATLWAMDLSRGAVPVNHLNAHGLMISGVTGDRSPAPLFYPASAACAVGAALVLWVFLHQISLLGTPPEKPRKPAWLGSLPFGRYSPTVFLSAEIKQSVRHPENSLFAGFFVLLSGGVVLASLVAGFELDRFALGLPLIIWVLCSLFAHNSYGRTLPAHWLVQVVPRRRTVWLAAKIVSNCAYCGALAALLFAVCSPASDQCTPETFVDTLPYGALLVLGLTLAGVVLPYSERYPFSSAFSALFGTVLALPLSYASGRLFSVVPNEAVGAAALALAAALVVLIYCADGWRVSGNPG